MCDEEKDSWYKFRQNIIKFNGTRVHKITNSLGVYDAYKFIRKNKWFNIGRPLTEHEFYSIIRSVNNYYVDDFLNGYNIQLPYQMGVIELRKFDAMFTEVNGKVKNNLPIDWPETLKLWYKNEEAYKKRTLVKMVEKEIFQIYYNKRSTNYTNMTFYDFRINRKFKQKVKQYIKEGKLDAFKL